MLEGIAPQHHALSIVEPHVARCFEHGTGLGQHEARLYAWISRGATRSVPRRVRECKASKRYVLRWAIGCSQYPHQRLQRRCDDFDLRHIFPRTRDIIDVVCRAIVIPVPGLVQQFVCVFDPGRHSHRQCLQRGLRERPARFLHGNRRAADRSNAATQVLPCIQLNDLDVARIPPARHTFPRSRIATCRFCKARWMGRSSCAHGSLAVDIELPRTQIGGSWGAVNVSIGIVKRPAGNINATTQYWRFPGVGLVKNAIAVQPGIKRCKLETGFHFVDSARERHDNVPRHAAVHSSHTITRLRQRTGLGESTSTAAPGGRNEQLRLYGRWRIERRLRYRRCGQRQEQIARFAEHRAIIVG